MAVRTTVSVLTRMDFMQSSFSMARNFLAALSLGLIMSSVSITAQTVPAFAAEPSQSNEDQA
jgi:hypothetical protein